MTYGYFDVWRKNIFFWETKKSINNWFLFSLLPFEKNEKMKNGVLSCDKRKLGLYLLFSIVKWENEPEIYRFSINIHHTIQMDICYQFEGAYNAFVVKSEFMCPLFVEMNVV